MTRGVLTAKSPMVAGIWKLALVSARVDEKISVAVTAYLASPKYAFKRSVREGSSMRGILATSTKNDGLSLTMIESGVTRWMTDGPDGSRKYSNNRDAVRTTDPKLARKTNKAISPPTGDLGRLKVTFAEPEKMSSPVVVYLLTTPYVLVVISGFNDIAYTSMSPSVGAGKL